MTAPKNNQKIITETPVAGQAVVLLHGIWMKPWVMKRIANRLKQQGYKTYLFGYHTVRCSPQQNAKSLAEFVSRIEQPVVHFVAHSLGGLVLLQYLNRCRSNTGTTKPGRMVFLGSPLKGSSRARRILKVPFGKNMLGRSVEEGLLGHSLSIPSDVEAGMISGTVRIGIGYLVGSFGEPHDGTVAVSETHLDGLQDHMTCRVTHAGLLTSGLVVQQIASFLQSGSFNCSVMANEQRTS